jgi:hypothetical protein
MKRAALALALILALLISLVPVVNAPSSSSSTPSVPPAMEWDAHYGGMSGLKGSQMIQTSDGGFALAGSWDFTGSVHYYYLVKTEPVLPPPTPTPMPSSPPSTGILSGENLALFASLAVAAVLIAVVAVAVFRRRKKQTLTTSFT